MDAKNRALLLHHQHSLVEDLDVSYIIDELFTRNAINTEEFDHIFQLTNRVDRTRFLIDTLLQSGTNDAYEAFVDSLAKDYHWLWEKLMVDHNEAMLNDSFEDSLSRGDVPRLPDHFVRRVQVQRTVAEKLKSLARHKFLVLHGMSGSGKTSVVIGVLRDNPDLITTNFNGVVFWMNLDGTKTEDDIVAQQNKLYRKASSKYAHNSYMNSSISMSSIGSNADSHSLSSYDWSWQDLRDRLKQQFSEPILKEALLVLDEVNEKKCVEAFDIGCKILITTRDTDVVANFQAQIINIENHFTENETLQLFASCLDVPVSQLPRQAKRLHEICKGSPFHLTLLGAQLAEHKERLIDDHRAWNYYLNRLEKKEFFFLTRNNNNPMKTIEMCINSLKPNVLQLFKKLTILPDNAKVSAKVLSKLWNKEVNEVESIMKQLRSKSLIIEFYDNEKKNYIYEIHDLIMNYLRTCTSEEDVKKLHSDFLKSYNYDNIAKAPVEIVDDGYIAFYIGHHILNTKNLNNKWQLFNRLFLDLKFLGNKVRLTGPADVILDLHKYENYIADDDFDHELLFSIKSYLSAHGNDLYRYPCTDIVQSILQHEVKGNLYTKALQIANEQGAKNELYFEFLHEQNVEAITPSNIDVKESITSVCFLGDYALVGTLTGMIKFFHISTNKLKKELPGTGSAIKWVGACPVNPPLVAALSFDGVIKVWYIDDLGQDDTDDVIEEEPEECYNNNYPSNGITIQPKRGAFIGCRWANSEESLLTHTNKLIVLYDCKGEVLKVIDTLERDREILCCIPCKNDRNAILATSGNANNLEIIDLTTKEKIMSYEENDILIDILTVPGSNRIVTLKQHEVVEHDFKQNASFANWNMCRCKKVVSAAEIRADLTFLSFAVNKSGTLLFVSTDDSRVICVDLKTYNRVFDLENRRGNVISMGVSEVCDDFMPGSDVLLTGTGSIEHSAKVWYLDAAYVSQTTRNGKTRLTTKFDVSFVQSVSPQTPQSPQHSNPQSTTSTPKRHQSFVNHKEVEKKVAKKTMSLDRHNLKPLILKGICNGNGEEGSQPLLAVVDDNNNIQIMRGRKILTEITTKHDEHVTAVKISPCNQYILYGLRNGSVIKYTLRTKDSKVIMDVYSPVQYLNFVNTNLLVVAGKDRCLMAYRLTCDGDWKPEMLQRGNTHLGSQEILNDIQGKKKISPPLDPISDSGSEASIGSRDRLFPNGDRTLSNCGGLLDAFWVHDYGLITVESNATIKLWNKELKLVTVLNGRQTDTQLGCTAYQQRTLLCCDDTKGFQTFELRLSETGPDLHQIQQYKLNNRIISCALTTDGLIAAMGLDSGEVVLWNVASKRQLRLLKHHKTRVQHCSFSPVPERIRSHSNTNNLSNTNTLPSPHSPAPTYAEGDEEQPPLVLVTMASEIVWWNVTYLIKMRASKGFWRNGWNVVTPIASPMSDSGRTELTAQLNNISLNSPQKNFFFGDGPVSAHGCWRAIWKKKTYKEGSKRKEILACIKLSGMNAKKLSHDDKFACFVTVDNPGHIHIMNIMRNST